MGYSKKRNLLFCALDIGGRIEHYTAFIKKKYDNVVVESFVKVKLPNKQYDAEYDYHFNYHNKKKLSQWIISAGFFVFTLFKYDIIYIISGENILTRKLINFEIWCYKVLKKKIVFHFVGGDIRSSDYLTWVNDSLIKAPVNIMPEIQQAYQIKLCELAQKYATFIIVSTPDLIEFFTKKVYYIPVFINHEKFKSYRFKKKLIASNSVKILHAPSNARIKGSLFIESKIKLIKLKHPKLEAIITTDKKHAENIHPPYSISKSKLISLMESSNIVVDQVVIGWYGLQSIEALITGNKVIVWIPKELTKYIQKDCPIDHYQNRLNIEETISRIVQEKNKNQQPLINDWVKKNHTIENNIDINKIFKSLLINIEL